MRLRLAGPAARLEPLRGSFALDAAARQRGLARIARLASNENALGPSPRALVAARRALRGVHRYPDPDSSALRTRLAQELGVPVEAIVLGHGSSALIDLLARTFLEAGASAVVSEGAFVVYRLAIAAAGGDCRVAPMTAARGHDLGAMAAMVDATTRLVFVANPNNPTGTYVGRTELEELLAALPGDVLVVIDDAYREYVAAGDYPDCASRAAAGAPIAVLRTFSKIHGLAGLRLGYAVVPPALAERLEAIRPPYAVSSQAEAAGVAALDDREHQARSREFNHEGLEALTRGLSALGIEVTPSVGNFLLFHLSVDGPRVDGPGLARRLLDSGVLVRPMGAFGFPDGVRVTVGTGPENRRFLRELGTALGGRGRAR